MTLTLTTNQREQQLFRLRSILINLRAIGPAPTVTAHEATQQIVTQIVELTSDPTLENALNQEARSARQDRARKAGRDIAAAALAHNKAPEIFPGTMDALTALCSVKTE